MNNSDLIKSAKEAVRNGTVLTQGVVDLLCDALAKSDEQLVAVVAENAALKEFVGECSIAQGEGNWTSDAEKTVYVPATEWMPPTTATDALIASLRAEGVEMFAEVTINIGKEEGDESIVYAGQQALLFAAQLRSQSEQVKGVQS